MDAPPRRSHAADAGGGAHPPASHDPFSGGGAKTKPPLADTAAATAARSRDVGGHEHEDIVTALDGVPCTRRFPPAPADLPIPAPHVPRAAGGAVSAEHPHAAPAATPAEADMTPLQHHVAPFFKPDAHGAVYPAETWRGFHAIGFNWLLAAVAALVIHATFAYWTAPSLWAFVTHLPRGAPVWIGGIDRGLHGSHSGTYDACGRYIPSKFEDIFASYGNERGDGITWRGILTMLGRNRSIMDPVGATAAFLEWAGLYWVAADHDAGVLSKEDVRAMYDGTLWEKLARRTAARRGGHGADGGGARPHVS